MGSATPTINNGCPPATACTTPVMAVAASTAAGCGAAGQGCPEDLSFFCILYFQGPFCSSRGAAWLFPGPGCYVRFTLHCRQQSLCLRVELLAKGEGWDGRGAKYVGGGGQNPAGRGLLYRFNIIKR